MYLVCCPKVYLAEIVDSLALAKINALGLHLIDFEYDSKALQFLNANINSFDYVIIPSPLAIDYASEAISIATHPKFVVVGNASKTKITKYTRQSIICPDRSSGGAALFTEKLAYIDWSGKKVLLVKGLGGSRELIKKMQQHNIEFTTINIYRRLSLRLPDEFFKKILLEKYLQGIIITSSILVEYLFKEAHLAQCSDVLKRIPFITIHTRIKNKLLQYGVKNIYVTANANKNEIAQIINLIKKSS